MRPWFPDQRRSSDHVRPWLPDHPSGQPGAPRAGQPGAGRFPPPNPGQGVASAGQVARPSLTWPAAAPDDVAMAEICDALRAHRTLLVELDCDPLNTSCVITLSASGIPRGSDTRACHPATGTSAGRSGFLLGREPGARSSFPLLPPRGAPRGRSRSLRSSPRAPHLRARPGRALVRRRLRDGVMSQGSRRLARPRLELGCEHVSALSRLLPGGNDGFVFESKETGENT